MERDIPWGVCPPGTRAVGKELPRAPQWVLARILTTQHTWDFGWDLGVAVSDRAQHILTPAPAAGGGQDG